MQQRFLNITMQIPDDIARLAHEQHLGAPQERFLITYLRRGWRWSLLGLQIALGLFLAEFVTLFLLLYTSADFLVFGLILIPLLILSYLAVFAFSITVRFMRKFCPIYTCDEGLILKQAPTKSRIMRWEEIETIRYTSTRLTGRWFFKNHLYSLRSRDGNPLNFTASRLVINNIDNLNKAIEDRFTRRRLPFQFADYQAGQTLSFGPLSLNREGIMVRDKRLNWEQVADLKLLKGRRLVIYRTGERSAIWLKLAAFKVPNLGLLLALFKRIRSGQSEQEAGFEALAAAYTTTTLVTSRGRVDALPEGLAALAEEHALGERRLDQYLGRSRLINWRGIAVLAIIDALLIGGAAFWGAASLPELTSQTGAPWLGVFIELLVLCLFLVPYITMNIIHGLQQIHNFTWTFERGLILKHGQQEPVICRWDELAVIWRIPSLFWIGYRRNTLFSQFLHGYTLQLRDGSEYTLTRFNINQVALGKIIKEQVVPLQLPAVVAAYQEGRTISFGQVNINQQGIAIGASLLPWSHVRSVGLEANRLVIYDIARRKPWSRLASADIPNLFLLFALADYARDITS